MHSSQLNHLTISSTSEQVFPVDKSLPLQYTFVSNETGVGMFVLSQFDT